MADINVTFKPRHDMTFNVECRSSQEVFQKVGPMQEVFGNNTCGKCGGHDIRLVHRTDDEGNDYYEFLCETLIRNNKPDKTGFPCRAKLALGETKKGKTLFPKRYATEKDSDGNTVTKTDADGNTVYLPDNGWVRWDREKGGYV